MKPSTTRTLIIAYLVLMAALGLVPALLSARTASVAGTLFSLSRALALGVCIVLLCRQAAISRVFVPLVMLIFVIQWAWLSSPLLIKRVRMVMSGTSDSSFLLGTITGQLIYVALLVAVGWYVSRPPSASAHAEEKSA